MNKNNTYGGLDRFRIVAALLIVAIHTSPLASVSETLDFSFSRVIARVAVPFFLMVTGYFLLPNILFRPKESAKPLGRFFIKTGLVYTGATLLYLPLSIYAGYYSLGNLPGDILRNLVFDGTFYHLWYLPASMLGTALLFVLSRKLPGRVVLGISLGLYLVGLLGDSYYGLTQHSALLSSVYGALFSVFSYTRNGLFYAPIFLCLGAWLGSSQRNLTKKFSGIGLAATLLFMLGEGLILHRLGLQRHDSMYITLLPCMYFLFQFLLSFQIPSQKRLRSFALWIYLLHPLFIVAVRGAAQRLGMTHLLVDNSVINYLAVCTTSVAASALITVLTGKKKAPRAEGSRAWIELDMESLRHNVSTLQGLLPDTCRLMPAVKADAYGHGAVPIARELNALGIRSFCVALVQEGVQLRKNRIQGDILILGYTHPDDLPLLRRYDLIQTVVDEAYAQQLAIFEKKLRVHVKIDTGMRRLGERSENLAGILRIFQYKNLLIEGVYTHLCADSTALSADREFTYRQVSAFHEICEEIREHGYTIPKTHILSSYGVINYPEIRSDYARVGIALYGMLGSREDTARCGIRLQPILSVKARISSVRELYSGEPVGYNLTFTAPQDMRIATLAIGYGDGVPRSLSCGVGHVLINGQRAPIVGLICMDQMVVDVTDIPEVRQGDIAVILGRSGDEELTACELAEKAGTITNEILSRLGSRLRGTVCIKAVKAPSRVALTARSFPKPARPYSSAGHTQGAAHRV